MAAIAPPALPVIPPRGFGDFQHCSVRYGVDILPADCQLAGVDLPSGPNLKTYYTTKSHDAAYTLPWSKTVGKFAPKRSLTVANIVCQAAVHLWLSLQAH